VEGYLKGHRKVLEKFLNFKLLEEGDPWCRDGQIGSAMQLLKTCHTSIIQQILAMVWKCFHATLVVFGILRMNWNLEGGW